MLGSRNSFTFLSPKKWWMRLLTPWMKCQGKTIEEQYISGVKYFDIYIAFKKDGSVRLINGCMEYSPHELFEALKTLQNKSDAYLQITFDIWKGHKNAKTTRENIKWFKNFIDYIVKYTNVNLDKAIVSGKWKHVLIDGGIEVVELDASVFAKWYECLCGPGYFAETRNDMILSLESEALQDDKVVLLMDFV